MIEPVAAMLCVARDRIFANTLYFEDDDVGSYKGFDADEPTSADMGKPKALATIKEKGGYNVMLMVGDGATDAQAKPPADSFIGFGGVIVRDAVRDKADWFVDSFDPLTNVVETYALNKLET